MNDGCHGFWSDTLVTWWRLWSSYRFFQRFSGAWIESWIEKRGLFNSCSTSMCNVPVHLHLAPSISPRSLQLSVKIRHHFSSICEFVTNDSILIPRDFSSDFVIYGVLSELLQSSFNRTKFKFNDRPIKTLVQIPEGIVQPLHFFTINLASR